MAEQSLKDKTVRGGAWSAIENFARYGITFIVGIILARLLTPDDYGLIGIITIFINIFNIIVDGGLGTALIRKLDATEEDYSTLFFTNLIVSIALAALLFILSPLISVFFERQELTPITKVMSVIIIINSLTIVQKVILTKKIDFKTQAKVGVFSSLLSGITGILMAIWGAGVWALVGQQLSLALFTTLFLWLYNKWIPRLVFRYERFKEMWSFGWKLLVSAILGTLWDDLYSVIIAKNYSPVTLGHYSRAYQFASICSSNINTVVQKVSYPVLCELQNDVKQLKIAYSKIIRVTMLPTFVLTLGLCACAEPMIYVLIGEQWMPCVPYLQILCFSMMLYPLHALNVNILQVVGRSDLVLKLRIIKLALAAIPLLLGVFFNIYIMLWGSVIISFLSYFINVYASYTFIYYTIKEQLLDILPSFLIAAFMSIVVYSVSFIPISYYYQLAIQVPLGAVVTIVLCETTKKDEYQELKRIVLSYLKIKK